MKQQIRLEPTREATMTVDRIIQEGIYTYVGNIPTNCKGSHYRVVRVDVLAVPSYQEQILVVALDGPDKGLLFVCSPWNFCQRYELYKETIHDNAQPATNCPANLPSHV
jgi:hypothetical protein